MTPTRIEAKDRLADLLKRWFHAGVEAAAERMLAELDIELPVADPAGVASEVAA